MPRSSSSASLRYESVWSVATNAARQRLPSDDKVTTALAAYTPTHSFRRDLLFYCKLVNVLPHPKLLPLHPDEDENRGTDRPSNNSSSSDSNTQANIQYDLSEVEELSVKNWQLDAGNLAGLCFALPQCPRIHTLRLFNVMLDDQQLEQVCQVVPTTQIQVLQLEWNAKAPSEVSNTTTALEHDANTQELSSQEEVGSIDHTLAYAKLLQNASSLTFVSLRANGITAQGAIAIASALKTNTTLRSLNLYQNDLRDEGALEIALALPYNKSLQTLSLANNSLTGYAAKALIACLTKYPAPPSLLKELEEAEPRIHAEIDHAKKAKKKIDRTTAMQNLGLPILETIQNVPYAPGNAVLEDLILSGNEAIELDDVLACSATLEAYQTKLQTHLCRIKLERIPALYQINTSPKLSEFLSF